MQRQRLWEVLTVACAGSDRVVLCMEGGSSELPDMCLEQCCSVSLHFLELLVKRWIRTQGQSTAGSGHSLGLSLPQTGPGFRLSWRPWFNRALSMVGIRDESERVSWAWSGVWVRPQSRTTVGAQSSVRAQFTAAIGFGLELGLRLSLGLGSESDWGSFSAGSLAFVSAGAQDATHRGGVC